MTSALNILNFEKQVSTLNIAAKISVNAAEIELGPFSRAEV